ncbi:phage portal protein [Nocardia sp. MH4]|uniref:phage portal protein n=1 Tax=Nocardia sp. MH4 TaxID=1768677 RepID=UPI001C4ED04C|nr:phage portal protein [Nocardia sp. MH4]
MIDAAMRPWNAERALDSLTIRNVRSEAAQARLVNLARKSQTNFLPLILDIFGQGLKVDNYLASGGQETGQPWTWWQRNRMDARQTGIHRTALQYGVSYATVLPSLTSGDDQNPAAVIRGVSPRQMTALYGEPLEWDPRTGGPVDDDWPIVALEMKGPMIRLYDEKAVHFIGVKNVPASALGWTDPTYSSVNNFEYIEGRNHDVGVCPVVRYRDRMLLDGEEVYGIIEPLMAIQGRIDETVFHMMASQYVAAFKQRYVTGWAPKDETEALRQAASDTWFFRDKEVKAGQFDETDLKNYIDSQSSAVRDLSAIAQIPPQAMGVAGISNLSEAALAGLESGRERKSGELETSLGESHEQLLRTCAHITGDAASAADFASEVKWADATARSFAQTVDGLGKLGTMLGIPPEILWEDIPGWTKTKVDRARTALLAQGEVPDIPFPPE